MRAVVILFSFPDSGPGQNGSKRIRDG